MNEDARLIICIIIRRKYIGFRINNSFYQLIDIWEK